MRNHPDLINFDVFNRFKFPIIRFDKISPNFLTSYNGWFVLDKNQVESVSIAFNKDVLLYGLILAGPVKGKAYIKHLSIYDENNYEPIFNIETKSSISLSETQNHYFECIYPDNHHLEDSYVQRISSCPVLLTKKKNLIEFQNQIYFHQNLKYTFKVKYSPDIENTDQYQLQLFRGHGNYADVIDINENLTARIYKTKPSENELIHGNHIKEGPILGFLIYNFWN